MAIHEIRKRSAATARHFAYRMSGGSMGGSLRACQRLIAMWRKTCRIKSFCACDDDDIPVCNGRRGVPQGLSAKWRWKKAGPSRTTARQYEDPTLLPSSLWFWRLLPSFAEAAPVDVQDLPSLNDLQGVSPISACSSVLSTRRRRLF